LFFICLFIARTLYKQKIANKYTKWTLIGLLVALTFRVSIGFFILFLGQDRSAQWKVNNFAFFQELFYQLPYFFIIMVIYALLFSWISLAVIVQKLKNGENLTPESMALLDDKLLMYNMVTNLIVLCANIVNFIFYASYQQGFKDLTGYSQGV